MKLWESTRIAAIGVFLLPVFFVLVPMVLFGFQISQEKMSAITSMEVCTIGFYLAITNSGD